MPRLTVAFAATLTFALAACGSTSPAPSQAAPARDATGTATSAAPQASAAAGLRLVRVGSFDQPLYVTAPRGDTRRVFVVEQGGTIRVVRGGKVLRTPFLDIRSQVVNSGEQGLLSMAFAPDYARSGRFYVYFTDRGEQQRIVEYRRASPDRANPRSARTVLRMADPAANHNGGAMVFGPDGLLYVGTGDGGGGNDPWGARGNAQDLGSLLGKLLRIDPRRSNSRPYRVPASNPFVSRAGARAEIYAYGLRNPWRFSFDRRTGALSIGDVGQNAVEEIDFTAPGKARGANFGWRPWEGTRRNFPGEAAPGHVRPVLEHRHDQGFCSITGGYVVRDPGLPALAGQYVYSDFCDGHVRAAKLTPTGSSADRRLAVPRVGSVSSFGEDARGRVYVVSSEGPVLRLASR